MVWYNEGSTCKLWVDEIIIKQNKEITNKFRDDKDSFLVLWDLLKSAHESCLNNQVPNGDGKRSEIVNPS